MEPGIFFFDKDIERSKLLSQRLQDSFKISKVTSDLKECIDSIHNETCKILFLGRYDDSMMIIETLKTAEKKGAHVEFFDIIDRDDKDYHEKMTKYLREKVIESLNELDEEVY